jgi:hypothetical protein
VTADKCLDKSLISREVSTGAPAKRGTNLKWMPFSFKTFFHKGDIEIAFIWLYGAKEDNTSTTEKSTFLKKHLSSLVPSISLSSPAF